MVISCGPNGQGSLGGHAHNDKLSFELCIDGEDIFIDPGTGVYTSNPHLRNYLRSAVAHSTLRLANKHSISEVSDFFILHDNSTTQVFKWEELEHQVVLFVKKTDKEVPKSDPFAVEQFFFYIKSMRAFIVWFRSDHQTGSPVILRLTLAPGLSTQRDEEATIKITARNCSRKALASVIAVGNPPDIRIVPALYSGQYGSVQDAIAIEYAWPSSKLYCGLIMLAGWEAAQRKDLWPLKERLYKELASWTLG